MCTVRRMREQPLVKLASRLFKRRGYAVKERVMMGGFSGVLQRFDLLITKSKEQRLVSVMDWKKTVGVNMIIKVDRASEDVGIPHPVVVAPKFSDHAQAYAHRRNVTLITTREIMKELI